MTSQNGTTGSQHSVDYQPAPLDPYQPYADCHRNPQGPGDARPTALDIIKDENLMNKWSSKVVLITGCTAGIGIETARALHETGATVYITARTEAKGLPIAAQIRKSSSNSAPIEVLEMDLSNLSSVWAAAKTFLSQSSTLNILICNAGIMATPFSLTADNFESQLGTNHIGHFALFQALKPALLSSSTPSFHSRVITVSSAGHRMSPIRFPEPNFTASNYNKWQAYGQSKLANIYMANSISAHYAQLGLHGLSLHPGVIITTDLGRSMRPEDFDTLGGLDSFKFTSKSMQQGAATSVWAATSAFLEGKGGWYLSDCGVAGPVVEGGGTGGAGYAAHAYYADAAERFWGWSYDAVGLERDN